MHGETNLFSVCPHDTARGLERWGYLNTFANRQIDLRSRYYPYLNFADFTVGLEGERFMWAYLNPADFLKVRGRFGYVGLVRPVDRFDVAYIVQAATSPVAIDLAALEGRKVAAVAGYLYRLVADRLRQSGIPYQHVSAKSYAEVMALVGRGEADFGVTYNEHFEPLTATSKGQYRIAAKVDAGLSHVVAVHPSAIPEEKRDALRALLLTAHVDEHGRKVLGEIGVKSFELVPEEPFDALHGVLDRAA